MPSMPRNFLLATDNPTASLSLISRLQALYMGNGNWVHKFIRRTLFRYFGKNFNGKLVGMVHVVADRHGNRFVNSRLADAPNPDIPEFDPFDTASAVSITVRS